MHKVFLVDDEIVIREGIRNSFPWDESGFALCGEAPDGEIALQMIQDLKPDIVITDIRMPFMDGLALSETISQTMPWIHIIILSGYDDFSYAQKAISIGVKEYLLKPVSVQKLGDALKSLEERIQRERAQQADLSRFHTGFESAAENACERIVADLLKGNGDISALQQEAAKVPIELESNQFLVVLLSGVPDGEKALVQGVMYRFSRNNKRVLQTVVDGNLAFLVLGSEQEDAEDHAYALALALEHEVGKNKLTEPTMAIGAPVSRLAELPQALASAYTVMWSMKGQSHKIASSMDVDLSSSIKLLERDSLPLHEKLRYAGKEESREIVEAYFASFGSEANYSVLMLNYMLMDILVAATRIIKQYGGTPSEVFSSELLYESELIKLSAKPEKVLEVSREIVEAALNFRDGNSVSRYGEILRKACAYIEEHYPRQEITLSDVASHVALSNNHFCTVFSQEMGLTFTEHLTNVRMAKAKELLTTTGKRTSEVANEIGYNDPRYFSYLFKKQTGLSPRDFRKKNSQL